MPLYHFLLASKQLSESNIYLSPSVKSFYPLKRHAFNSQIFILSQLTKIILGVLFFGVFFTNNQHLCNQFKLVCGDLN